MTWPASITNLIYMYAFYEIYITLKVVDHFKGGVSKQH